MNNLTWGRGRAIPLGSSWTGEGINFAVISKHATSVNLLLYHLESSGSSAKIELDPALNRTGDHWHILVKGLPPVFRYAWQVDGPTRLGHSFSPEIPLLDPSATAITGGETWGKMDPEGRFSLFQRRNYNWQEDRHPAIPPEDTILYELHVRGYTKHSSSEVSYPGTFLGLLEKIPHLKSLGITALELLPIHEFDETDCPFINPQTGKKNLNLWGYNTIGFAAVKASLAASGPDHGQMHEFRDLVAGMHREGIEVILDVVFNHTGEGGINGRTLSFRGLDDPLFYMIDSQGRYLNFSGCGNTVNCNQPVVRELIIDCLRFWILDMHVDGFRFDLASVLGRDRHGRVMADPPVVEMIAEDGVLASSKLIAEPWDADGLYQVGNFPFGRRWSEWNGQYRDTVRRFWLTGGVSVGELATRICGSADLYELAGRTPSHSVNFITSHDGFTLWDLVSYSKKHNLANGEGNRDGTDQNYSNNCGVEGPTQDPEIMRLRLKRARNLMATLLLSQGMPMILGGDEILRTQKGNNNAWCQDNEISWVDWRLQPFQSQFLRFTKEMIAFRKRHSALNRREFLNPEDVSWHGQLPLLPDFSQFSGHIALQLFGSHTGREPDQDLYIAFSMEKKETWWELPHPSKGKSWARFLDTTLEAPNEVEPSESREIWQPGQTYRLGPEGILVMVAKPA